MSRKRVQSGAKDAAPDLTPEPRRDTPSERSIEMKSTALLDPARQVALIRSIASYATGREAAALAEIAAVVNGAGIHDLLEMRGV